MIRILPSTEINTQQWDQCIAGNKNGLIYSTTTFLNALCEQWHGLVIDDYTAVIALPWRKKLGIRYLYTPAFIQQLGFVGEITTDTKIAALNFIQCFISYGDMSLNFSNQCILETHPAKTRTNLVIDLNRPLPIIRSGYKPDLQENIRKAYAHRLSYTEGDINEAITCFRKQYGARITQIKDRDYQNFTVLCRQLSADEQCFVRCVYEEDDGLLAIGIFLMDNNRIYNILNTTLPEGRDLEANHFLFDNLITEFAGKEWILDMEGSELPGVKQFYESFGAINQPYFHYHYNNYPWLIKLLKK